MVGNDFNRDEVDSIYVVDDDRFVVSLIVGYKPDRDDVQTPSDAAFWALDLTQDAGWDGTVWCVFDRVTGVMHHLEQDEFAEWSDDRFVLRTDAEVADG